VLVVLSLAGAASAQEVGSKNLTSPAEVQQATQANANLEPQFNECKELTGPGFVDGFTRDRDNKPRKLRVELVKISTLKLVLGSEITAIAKLQNVDRKSIQIPWSTDFRTISDGQSAYDLAWEVAEFRMSIRDRQNPHYYDKLVMTSPPLYASKFVPGSYLTMKPGEWITAQISFKVAVRRSFEKLDLGTNKLALEWFHTARTRVVKDCGVTLGYFPYDQPIEAAHRREVATVQIKDAGANAPAKLTP